MTLNFLIFSDFPIITEGRHPANAKGHSGYFQQSMPGVINVYICVLLKKLESCVHFVWISNNTGGTRGCVIISCDEHNEIEIQRENLHSPRNCAEYRLDGLPKQGSS